MLTFYYHPLSPIARRVWIALLEKEIPFEAILVDLSRRAQFEATFLEVSPFHHVPALVHNKVQLVESIAILDYLDLQFPQTLLSPSAPEAIAKMRMVQMVVTNELLSKLIAVVTAEDGSIPEKTSHQIETCFQFLEKQLNGREYFGENKTAPSQTNHLDLADIVAGSTVPLFQRLGLSLQAYPALERWSDRITQRPAWQTTRPSDEDFEKWTRWIRLQVQRGNRNQQRKQSSK